MKVKQVPLSNQLQDRFNRPLPGLSAQLELASTSRGRSWSISKDHKKSAILALLYPNAGDWHTVFMKRSEDGRVHGGQISFPGGRMEKEDHGPRDTALREAEEELGISPKQVKILGQLTELFIPVSNYLVYPVVGIADQRPDFVPCEREVAEVIETPISHLLQPETKSSQQIRFPNGHQMQVPSFSVGKHVIWGATAMILNELIILVREIEKRPLN